jgi:histidinol-phosphate/aromatic aminotransferase/cobyric acid decarboxylase-like protein
MIPVPGPHGGDGAAVARALGLDPSSVLDLSASLNPFAPDAGSLLARHAGAVRRYPDGRAATDALAHAIGCDPGRLLLTNGGSEAIRIVAEEQGGGVLAEPEFSLHPRAPHGPRWRSDPHSPSGRLADASVVADVWDEAFYPLATGHWTAGRPAVVVGSLTKVFACPGLRLGYVLADDVDRYRRHQPGWPVSTVALAVLPDLLATADLEAWAAAIAAQRALLAKVLDDHGLTVEAGDAPWVLVRCAGLRERLAPEGVVVRDCASFGLDGWARIAVPDDDGVARLAGALERTAP